MKGAYPRTTTPLADLARCAYSEQQQRAAEEAAAQAERARQERRTEIAYLLQKALGTEITARAVIRDTGDATIDGIPFGYWGRTADFGSRLYTQKPCPICETEYYAVITSLADLGLALTAGPLDDDAPYEAAHDRLAHNWIY